MKKPKLRPYQTAALRKVKHPRTVLVSPTGSGKTVMGAAWVARNKAPRVLWIAHRLQLLRQAADTLADFGVKAYVVHGTDRSPPDDTRVLLVTVQTLARNPYLAPCDALVIDEAHRGVTKSYQLALDACSGSVLGLTATPWRLDGQGLGSVFDSIVVATSAAEMVANGHSACPVVYAASFAAHEALHKDIQVDRDKAEAGIRMVALAGDTVKQTELHAGSRPALIFAVNKKHGKALVKRFKETGRSVAYVDEATPEKVRRAVIEGIRSGEFERVVNVTVFAEGLDVAELGVVVLARPTNSLTMLIQQCGRAMRNGAPVIVDVAGNVHTLGHPLEEPEWSLEDRSQGVERQSGVQRSKVRFCSEGHANVRHVEECVTCGLELAPCEIIESDAELERVDLRDRILGVAKLRGWDAALTKRVAEAIAGAA